MSRSNIAGVVSALAVIAVLVLLGIWLFTRAATQDTATTPVNPVPEAPTEVGGEAVRTYDTPPEMMIDPEKDYTATITTPRGDIVIELLPEIAPQTVNNFVFLSREGFYDGLTWHRVIPGFMAQGGDPAGTGMGGPGYTIPAEFTSEILFDRPGIVAMARRGNDINSAGSQFFITNAVPQNPEVLNNQYTIFGEVVEGQDIVNNIPPRDPNTAIEPGEQIRSITIEESE